MSDSCKYFAMGGDNFFSMLGAAGKLKSVQGVLDPFILGEWESIAAQPPGLGRALEELGRNAERFAPLDATPVQLQTAWKLLSDTLNAHAEKLAWATRFKRAGLTSPSELQTLVDQIHETKCLELLLPTPLSGATKSNIVALCRFLEKHNNGSVWILGVEMAPDAPSTQWKIG